MAAKQIKHFLHRFYNKINKNKSQSLSIELAFNIKLHKWSFLDSNR